MPTEARIVVLGAKADGSTAALDNADVILVKKEELGASRWPHDDLNLTHTYAAGRYVSIVGSPFVEPDSGEYLLVATAPDHNVLVQRLTFSLKNDVVQIRPGWSGEAGNRQLAAISIVNYGEQKKDEGDAKSKQSLLTITLYPPRYVVTVASKKTDASYNIFNDHRRDYIFETGTLNSGAVHIRVSARTADIKVFAKDISSSSKGWLEVGDLLALDSSQAPTMMDFYATLNFLGERFPKSVVEAAFHGHSWHGGPLVWNTFDNKMFHIERDPKDADGRCKDFLSGGPIEKQFPKLKDAFADDGRFFSSGCVHIKHVYQDVRVASEKSKTGTAADVLYEVPLNSGEWLFTSLDFTKFHVAQYAQSKIMLRHAEHGEFAAAGAYLGFAAQFLPCPVFGSPIGVEGNMGTAKSPKGRMLSVMLINDKISSDTAPILRYLKATYGEFFEQDKFGYMNYSKLLDAPLPDPGWNTKRSAFFSYDEGVLYVGMVKEDWILRLPSGLMVALPNQFKAKKPIEHTEGSSKGHLYRLGNCRITAKVSCKFPSGSLKEWLLIRPHQKGDPDEELALFVADKGGTHVRVRAPGAKDWEKGTKLITTHLMNDFGDSVPVSTCGPDEIEKVSPRCYW